MHDLNILKNEKLQTIVENFEFLEDWDDRYRYLIELGRTLRPLDDSARTETNKVRGCASQVWLETIVHHNPASLEFHGDSDAHIVRGLVALIIALYSGLAPEDIIKTDAMDLFARLGLSTHLTPQRSNGVRSMVERIKSDAQRAMKEHASPDSH